MDDRSNPREKTNFVGFFLWTWTIKFLKVGYRKVLSREDLYNPLRGDRSNSLGDRLQRYWNEELQNSTKRKRSPSLTKTLLRCFLWEILLLGFLQIFNEVLVRLGIPLLLGQLLSYFREDNGINQSEALIYAASVSFSLAVYTILLIMWVYKFYHVAGRIRIAICSVIYRKALRLNLVTSGNATSGKIVNLLANDVNRFEYVVQLIHYLWMAPLITCIVGYYLWTEAGYSGLFGMPVILSIIPIQSYIGKLSAKIRLQTTKKTDERVRLLNEIISGIQVIKMYAWEKPFCKVLALIRKSEIIQVRKNAWIHAFFITLWLGMPRVALYCTLVGMMLSGKPPSTEKIFIFFTFYWVVAEHMGFMFSRAISEVTQCRITVERLEDFLETREFQDSQNYISSMDTVASKRISKYGIVNIDDDKSKIGNNQDISIEFGNLTAKWNGSSTENTLDDVNVKIERGKMYVMIGGVGHGKSSLISAILGEISIYEGHIDIHGSISYASQEAWMFGSSVRQNILFGKPYEARRYQEVVKTCALVKDFDQLPQGDETILVERGSSLSGGQKARINLARSVYRESDIYIFDDPLSAVDTHVAQHLFEECFKKYLCDRTRILVTHQVQYISKADVIFLLEHGKLLEFKNHRDLLLARPEYQKLLSNSSSRNNSEFADGRSSTDRRLTKSRDQIHEISDIFDDSNLSEDNTDGMKLANSLETTSKGTMPGSLYINYLRIGNNWFFILMVLMFSILTQCAITSHDIFYSRMVETEEKRYDEYLKEKFNNFSGTSQSYKEFDIEPAYHFIYTYTAVTLSILIFGIFGTMLFYVMCLSSSESLHNRAFESLIKTSMQFFSLNPSGRILNRFSKDIDSVDELLPKNTDEAIVVFLFSIGAFIVICRINAIFTIPILIIIPSIFIITKIYLKANKNLRRLEGITRSSIFTHLNLTMDGLMTIRASGAQKLLTDEFNRFQDDHTAAWYMSTTSGNAFLFYIGMFCCIFTTLLTFGVVIASNYATSDVGLAITLVIAVVRELPWGIRQICEIVNHMIAVERIFEYTYLQPEDNFDNTGFSKIGPSEKFEEENGGIQSISLIPSNWPTGCIAFKHVSLKYGEDSLPVLKDLNFVINPKEKIGIIGRTGAGKSSLISALFRLTNIEGSIEIDGINIKSINLEHLRRRIAIIPQEPVLFSGNVRMNLDPFDEFSDKVLWSVLDEVDLKEAIMREANGLDSIVVDKGANFSIGQRQLICLARAILRNNKILVLDEATANVDPHTDRLIQNTIRRKFLECTVVTVAHRLNTIIDSDKVLVMDDGCIEEFDHPYVLLQNQDSKFASLVNKSGMSDTLMQMAEESYKKENIMQAFDFLL